MNAQELKDLRIKSGLTQDELANEIGLHRNMINKYEKGKAVISKTNELAFMSVFNNSAIIQKIKRIEEDLQILLDIMKWVQK